MTWFQFIIGGEIEASFTTNNELKACIAIVQEDLNRAKECPPSQKDLLIETMLDVIEKAIKSDETPSTPSVPRGYIGDAA